jgi:hypothetical protein
VSWNKRDLLLYAAGIGAKADDLSLVYGTFVSTSTNHFQFASTHSVVIVELGVCSPVLVHAEMGYSIVRREHRQILRGDAHVPRGAAVQG